MIQFFLNVVDWFMNIFGGFPGASIQWPSVQQVSKLHFWLMPWLDLPDGLDVGPYSIWEFYKHGPSRIASSQHMLSFAQFVSCVQDDVGVPRKEVFFLQVGANPFDLHDPDIRRRARWFTQALCFCSVLGSVYAIAASGKTLPIVSSERFQTLSFLFADDHVIYESGRAVRVGEISGRHVHLFEPPFLEMGAPFLLDGLMLEALVNLNENQYQTDLWRRLSLVFDWFYNAWTGTPDISDEARLIMCQSAFEAVFVQNSHSSIHEKAIEAEALCGWGGFTKVPHSYTNRGGTVVTNQKTKPVKWLLDYAEARNQAAHGHQVTTQIDVSCKNGMVLAGRAVYAIVLYIVIAKRLMKQNGFDNLPPSSKNFYPHELVSADQHVESMIDKLLEVLQWK